VIFAAKKAIFSVKGSIFALKPPTPDPSNKAEAEKGPEIRTLGPAKEFP
jgi:hypothetical protein